MKKGGGSAKGSTFEREICKALSLWWTEGERDDIFWRTAGSGGRATNRAKRGARTSGAYGDLTFTDPIGSPLLALCCFELKRGYGSWCVLDLIDKKAGAKPSTAALFWEQAKTSAEQAGSPWPIVIFRRDQKRTTIMLHRGLLLAMGEHCGPHRGPKLQTQIGSDGVVLMPFDDWLSYFEPQAMRVLYNAWCGHS